ncbi:MAG: ATP-binding protein [Bradyrhizobium sp.]|uniref:ATP-binding protein n=1 Tax=Bradyrhizobium sp. TaxID=376 RepID=UPI003D1334AA
MTKHPIPDSALDADIAILGRKGGGKTYTAKGIVERLLDMGRRVLVLDPLGVWAGLRTAADGEAAGYPVAIFGGAHADMPLDTAAAVAMADVLARENVPAVIDLSELTKGAQQSFLLAFLHELRRVNTEAMTLVLEEADVFAPQNPQGDDSKQLHHEIDWIARRGRFKGFRLITICQRPARLSKDVLTQAATLVSHRLPAPQDRDAVKAWVEGNGDRDEARKVFDSLGRLEVGEAWVWASELGMLERVRFPVIKTLDTSATPKAGEKRIEPKTLAQVDLTAIRTALDDAASKRDKPTKSAKNITGNIPADSNALRAAEERGYQHGYDDGDAAGHGRAITHVLAEVEKLADQFNGLREALLATQEVTGKPQPTTAPAPARQSAPPTAKPRASHANGTLNSAARKMLDVLDTNPPVKRSWTQVATLAGLKARGGHFNAGKKALIEGGYLIADGSTIRIAQPSAAAPAARHDPTALVDMWAGALSGAAPKVLRYLFESGGEADRTTVAADLGMQPRGGHWNAAWKELRDNGIVAISGQTAQLTELFR